MFCAIYAIILGGQWSFELPHTHGVCLCLPSVAVNSYRMGLYGMLPTPLHTDLHSVQTYGEWESSMVIHLREV